MRETASETARRDSVVYIVDLKDLSFVFVVYFIRAHLRGASLGTRLSGVLHGPILALETEWFREERRHLFNEISNQ